MNTKTALFKANIAIRLSINFVMAPCKWHLKATRHLICSSCSNWVDFVKSGCEKSWAEVQADSFYASVIGPSSSAVFGQTTMSRAGIGI